MEALSQLPVRSSKEPATPAYLLGWHDTEVLGGAGDPRALVRDIGIEIGRSAEIGDLPGEAQPFLDRRINGLANIRGDAFANSLGHGRRAEKADKAVESKVWIASLRDRGHIGHDSGSRRIRHRQQLDLAGLKLWSHDRERRHVDLDASDRQIVGCFDQVAIRNF